MSVRFSASTTYLSRAGISSGAFTCMGWFYIAVDRNAVSVFLQLNDFQAIETDVDGTTLTFWSGSATVTGAALEVGRWYHIAVTASAVNSGSGVSKVYVDGVLNITSTGNVSTSGNLSIGRSSVSTEWLNGRAAFCKGWNAVLTPDEIRREMYSVRPVRRAALYGWWPTVPGAVRRGRDLSGYARNLTENGALTDEENPNVKNSYSGSAVAAPVLHGVVARSGNVSVSGSTAGAMMLQAIVTRQKSVAEIFTAVGEQRREKNLLLSLLPTRIIDARADLRIFIENAFVWPEDEPGLVMFMIASAIYELLQLRGIDPGIDAPGPSNAAEWAQWLKGE